MAYLYRGVHAHHPAIAAARRGEVHPANPHSSATPQEHNHDANPGDSPYSSWTASIEWARFHRDKTGPGGVLLRVPQGAPGPKDNWHWEYSPDEFFEEEVLLHGVRMGVEVIP